MWLLTLDERGQDDEVFKGTTSVKKSMEGLAKAPFLIYYTFQVGTVRISWLTEYLDKKKWLRPGRKYLIGRTAKERM